MQRPDSLPPIGSLVRVQARHGIPYLAIVVGHPDPRRPDHPVVEVVSSIFEGRPYDVFVEFVRVVG
jgi:hypothetical protein